MKSDTRNKNERPPIVAIVGHIDHGKSTLLDYIRRTNVVASEAGGITQHLSAYEAEHETPGGLRHITFLDTPGHEAFTAMRLRGLEVADIAVLVVSAEDGVKPQTLETLRLIQQTKLPFIVAFTKIDKPDVDIEKAKMSLLENGTFLEGMGGEVPYIPVSGKTGVGVSELLDLIILAADLEGLSADSDMLGEGYVIEANMDTRRGNTATLIVKNGTVKSGQFIVTGTSYAPVRIMENFLGKAIKEALPGSPVRIVGFSTLPKVGEAWNTVHTKKEAESQIASIAIKKEQVVTKESEDTEQKFILPLIIKTDVAGSIEAVLHELQKFKEDDRIEIKIVAQNVGPISESDVRLVGAGATPGIILGFNVKIDREAKEVAERLGVRVGLFDVIYKVNDWLKSEIDKRRPKQEEEELHASARILKIFSTMKGKVVIGGRVEEGILTLGTSVKILRRDIEVGRGDLTSLQAQRVDVKKIDKGQEFGAVVKLSGDIAANDLIVAFDVVYK